MNPAIIGALVFALVVCAAIIILLRRICKKQVEKINELESIDKMNTSLTEVSAAFEQMSAKVQAANASFEELNTAISNAQSQKMQAEFELKQAETRRQAAVELAEKDLALEGEKRRAEFNAQLDKEFFDLKQQHPVTKYRTILEELNLKIEEGRKTLRVQQEQALKKEQAEEFWLTHSVNLTEAEKADIEKIMSFAPQLSRIEAFYKLIWTEYYQKPLQKLCKELGAEKICGIYKITATDGRCYIGQSVDIAARWKEHVKCGLGIGSTSYQSNKFYRSMHTQGPENFSFEILEICGKEALDDRERYWIDYFNSITFGFNTKVGG